MIVNDRECSGIHKFEYSHVPKYSNIRMNEHTKMFNVRWPLIKFLAYSKSKFLEITKDLTNGNMLNFV